VNHDLVGVGVEVKHVGDKGLPRVRPGTVAALLVGVLGGRSGAQQRAVRLSVLPVAHRVDEGVDDARGPGKDRRQDVHCWPLCLQNCSFHDQFVVYEHSK